MDQQTFDRFTRAMATGQSRRAVLRRLFGVGAATVAGARTIESTLAAPARADSGSGTILPLQEPDEPNLPTEQPVSSTVPQAGDDGTCPEPLEASDCGCLDPATQMCCQDQLCTGVCTPKDGCCNVSTDRTLTTRGEVCGDYCCHPHLDPSDADYSECCDQSCCAGHCYGENLCCPVDQFCPGASEDLCCGTGERCCGAGTESNACIPAGVNSCCGVDDCPLEDGACSVSCDANFCRQHICAEGAVCCTNACVTGNCCGDGDCAADQACLAGVCTTVECFTDSDCITADACSVPTCNAGTCSYVPLCPGECSTCTDGVCSTDDTLCGLCGTCEAGTCTPVVCPDGYSCYEETGECLGIA